MTTTTRGIGLVPVLRIPMTAAVAQERSAGTAIIHADQDEYTIPIECDDASHPELVFSTQPSRITKQATGGTSGVRLGLTQPHCNAAIRIQSVCPRSLYSPR